MKVCIYGLGAIGGFIGYHLAKGGHDVSAVARGKTLEALRRNGLRFESARQDSGLRDSVSLRASEDPASLGAQDLVVIAVKGYSLPDAAGSLAPLVGPDTIVLPAMNGVPWWFFQGAGGKLEGTVLKSVDPGGRIARVLPASSVMGCAVHIASSCPEPGLVSGGASKRLILGEPSGERTARLEALARALSDAGLAPEVSTDIRTDLWYKLWGNITMNPLSALTGATMDRILDDPFLERLCLDMMEEAREVGKAVGCPIAQSGAERLALARTLGAFRTSMLQDLDAGKPLEIDALLGAVHEIGALAGISTPSVDAVLGLVGLLDRTRQGEAKA